MENIMKVVLFSALLASIKTDENEYDEGDMQSELRSILEKVQSLSIDIAKLQQKQTSLEKCISNFHTEGSDDCLKEISKSAEHIQNIQDISGDGKNENYFAIKRAFSSEKKHLRSMIHSWEKEMESAESHQKSAHRKDVAKEIAKHASITLNLSKRLQEFKKRMEAITNLNLERIDSMEENFGTMKNKSEDFEKKIDLMSSSISSSDRKVSFSVQYKPQEGFGATIYGKGSPIRFKMVIYNDGEGYNETTGIFTVPVDGVYQFIFFVEGWHQGDTFTCPDAIVALYIDGKAEAAAVADPRHDKQFATGGNTYINYLTKGQKVQIGTARTCEQFVIFGYRTSFSGHLLY